MRVVLDLCDSKLFILYSSWVQFYDRPLALSWLAQISNAISSEKAQTLHFFLLLLGGFAFTS